MQSLLGKHWHHLPAEEVVDLLDSDAQHGLDVFAVAHRQERFGLNQVTPRKGKSPLVRFLLQLNHPLIYILLISALITILVKQELFDAMIILGVVLINALIGYFQESKAEKAIEALARSLESEATVTRASQTQRVVSAQLVPGDIVMLKAGDKVPADLRLLRSRDLQISESALTGESLPVEKDALALLSHDMVLAERSNMAYTSTLVTYGSGTGIVVATGDQTEIGRISQLLSSVDSLETPLTRKMASFGRVLMYAILALAALAMLVGILRGQPVADTITAGIALAVAAIPEGLPAALTITLAIGVSRMARRKAIVRKLPAVETLGSVTVICSDKTGTLTQNQMTVQQIAVDGGRYQVTGSGYAPQGQILDQQAQAQLATGGALAETLRAGLLCNDSAIAQQNGRWESQGDPTETALIVSALKAGLDESVLRRELPRLDEIPFDSQHQYMATLHDAGEGQPRRVYLKGAVEALLERCDSALDAEGQQGVLDVGRIHLKVEELAQRGLRVLAFARAELPPGTQRLVDAQIASGLVFLGLQAMIDPPRTEAIAAVKASRQAGIRIKMITGDHAITAAAIASQFGMGLADQRNSQAAEYPLPIVVTGKELAEKTDSELIELVQQVDVFARVSPEQKLRLVDALQARGEVVAMTGDGVNDGPALKQANIGVAMGITGTEVAKEAADMVLTDDNFATIEAAVEEGRGVYDNLIKIIAWTLPTNLGEGMIILLAILLGVALPILPVQILWINMVTVAVLGLVLALEPKEPGIMQRTPRNPQAPILTRHLLWRTAVVGSFILAGAFGIFEWELISGASVEAARTASVNMVIVISMFYLFNSRSLTQTVVSIGFSTNPWAIAGFFAMLLIQLAYTYLPVMNRLFESAPLGLEAWVKIFIMGFIGFLLIETEKIVVARRKRARGA
jgi:Ca2+-transporting ATPase